MISLITDVVSRPEIVLCLGIYFLMFLYKKYMPNATIAGEWENRIIPLLSAALGAILIYLPGWTGPIAQMGGGVKWLVGIVLGAGGANWVHSIVSKSLKGG